MEKEYAAVLLGFIPPIGEYEKYLKEKDFFGDFSRIVHLTEEETNFGKLYLSIRAEEILKNKKDVNEGNYEYSKRILENMLTSIVIKTRVEHLKTTYPDFLDEIYKTLPITQPDIPGLSEHIRKYNEPLY